MRSAAARRLPRRERLREALAQVLAAPAPALPPRLELAAVSRGPAPPLRLLRVTDLPAARLQLHELLGPSLTVPAPRAAPRGPWA